MNADVSTARSRRGAWWRGALLTAALAGTAALVPAQRAHAADVQVRVLVDVADLIFRSGRPYYHDRGYYHPVVVEYDRWHRPVYYRYEPRPVVVYRPAPPPRYYAPPRHHAPPPGHYRVGYYDDRRHDRDRHHGKGKGRGHGHDRRRGYYD